MRVPPAAITRGTADGLPGHSQGFTARRENPQRRRSAEQSLGDLGAGVDQVLAVIQDEQEMTIAQVVAERGAGRTLRALPDTQGGRDRLRYQIGHRERRQIDQPHAIAEFVHEATRQLYRQARLSNPAGTRQRQQPR
jgi:hypothetical protein